MTDDLATTAPIANPFDLDLGRGRLWCVTFGAYGSTHVYAWADSLEDAFEEAVEHLDDEGLCGHFTILTSDDYQAAAPPASRVNASLSFWGAASSFAESTLRKLP